MPSRRSSDAHADPHAPRPTPRLRRPPPAPRGRVARRAARSLAPDAPPGGPHARGDRGGDDRRRPALGEAPRDGMGGPVGLARRGVVARARRRVPRARLRRGGDAPRGRRRAAHGPPLGPGRGARARRDRRRGRPPPRGRRGGEGDREHARADRALPPRARRAPARAARPVRVAGPRVPLDGVVVFNRMARSADDAAPPPARRGAGGPRGHPAVGLRHGRDARRPLPPAAREPSRRARGRGVGDAPLLRARSRRRHRGSPVAGGSPSASVPKGDAVARRRSVAADARPAAEGLASAAFAACFAGVRFAPVALAATCFATARLAPAVLVDAGFATRPFARTGFARAGSTPAGSPAADVAASSPTTTRASPTRAYPANSWEARPPLFTGCDGARRTLFRRRPSGARAWRD